MRSASEIRYSTLPGEGGTPLGEGVARIRVGQVGGDDQRLLVVAAVGDDGGDGVFDPVGHAVRAQIVEQQDLGVEGGAVGFPVART